MNFFQLSRKLRILSISALTLLIGLICLITYCITDNKAARNYADSSFDYYNQKLDPNAPDPSTMVPGKVYDYIATDGTNVSAMLVENTMHSNNLGQVVSSAYVELVSSTDKSKLYAHASAFPIHSRIFTDMHGNERTFYYRLCIKNLNISNPKVNENQIATHVAFLRDFFSDDDWGVVIKMRCGATEAHEKQHYADLTKYPILCVAAHKHLTQVIEHGNAVLSDPDKKSAQEILGKLYKLEGQTSVILESRAVAAEINYLYNQFQEKIPFKDTSKDTVNLESEKFNNNPKEYYAYTLTDGKFKEQDGLNLMSIESLISKENYASKNAQERQKMIITWNLSEHKVPIKHREYRTDLTPTTTYEDAYKKYFSTENLDKYNDSMTVSETDLIKACELREQYFSELLAIHHLYKYYKDNLPNDKIKSTNQFVADWDKEVPIAPWLNAITEELKKINGPYDPESEIAKNLAKLIKIYPKFDYDDTPAQYEAQYHFYMTVSALAEHNFYFIPDANNDPLHKNSWCYYIDETQRHCSSLFENPSPGLVVDFYSFRFTEMYTRYSDECRESLKYGPYGVVPKSKKLTWLIQNKSKECGAFSKNYFESLANLVHKRWQHAINAQKEKEKKQK